MSEHGGILIHRRTGCTLTFGAVGRQSAKSLHPLKQVNKGNVAATWVMENADV